MDMTSADLEPALLQEAKEVLGVKSNREAIEQSLRSVVTRHRQLVAARGIAGLQLDPAAKKVDHPLVGDE